MSQQGIPSRVISDPFRFAAEARSIQGEVAVADLLRLSDVLASTEGVVRWKLEGSLVGEVARREPRLRLTASGQLDLCCQRCLGGLAWVLKLDTQLQLVRAGQPIPEEELENDEFDAIEVGDEFDALALLEDEILLALPVAPRHENCDAPRPVGGASKESPFAALASLRGSPSAK
ncbi:YceD family protein [Thauera chlorobenzoica]|uniref:Large ribosomal RNA subunit accumulation protein YceD n=1 Tax=Thauera chlorobenzoica TaxID=96773 RepID=A0A1H5RR74_9RHOO|nr:YceD family protein [Thauera chlorobenzoica]APR05223.1 DUF177 protein [Thauera chlorobenzoica]SEF40067.1 uncharacterized protein SAMN05216242_10181 [Thauera chlorobenzoica]